MPSATLIEIFLKQLRNCAGRQLGKTGWPILGLAGRLVGDNLGTGVTLKQASNQLARLIYTTLRCTGTGAEDYKYQ